MVGAAVQAGTPMTAKDMDGGVRECVAVFHDVAALGPTELVPSSMAYAASVSELIDVEA